MSSPIKSNESLLTGVSNINTFKSIDYTSSKSIPSLYINNNYQSSSLFTYHYHHYPLLPIQSLFINDVGIYTYGDSNKKVDIASVTENNDDNITIDIKAQLPLFFINRNLIKVPSKIEYALRRYTPKSLLYDIHKNFEVAIEMCLIFTTQLTSTYFGIQDGSSPEGWKSLMAKYIRELLNPVDYKKVIKALEAPLKKGQILECDYKPIIGEKCHFYRLGDAYIGKSIVSYDVRTKEAINALNKNYFRMLATSKQNRICQNLISIYPDITLPSLKQINTEAKRLIKLGYKTKKGKKLTFLNKHPKDYYKDANERSFVEDAIKIYQYLTDNGLMIPVEGSDESGGRVVDSFTLMPSWIRRLVKLNGKTLRECDYTALHPNIAIKLYGGITEFIAHGDLASDLKVDLDTVKVEHLSFFNKKIWSMKQSPLFDYYSKNETVMLDNIIREKLTSQYKHKITSRRMFEQEVEIMTDVIKQLNDEGIYVLYVYDALLCSPKHAERVANLMDETILKLGIKTTTKISSGKKYNPIVVKLKETKWDEAILNKLMTSKTNAKPKDTFESICIPADEINFNIGVKESILKKIKAGDTLKFIDAVIKFPDGDTVKDKVMVVNDPINIRLKYVTHTYIYDKSLSSRVT
jgi:hypothetical protein